MIVSNVDTVYRYDAANNGYRITEWRTYVNEHTHKQYQKSTTYTVQLYSRLGRAYTYSNERTVDITV